MTAEPSYEIVNIVATAKIELDPNVTVRELYTALLGSDGHVYKPERFPGIVYQPNLNGKSVTLLVFRTGNVVVVGAKDIEELKAGVKAFLKAIKFYLRNKKVELRVQNIVAKAELPVKHVDLESLSMLPGTEYAPELFPGLIFKLGKGKPTVLLFSTGSMVIVGARNEDEIKEAIQKIMEKVGVKTEHQQ